jgi:hypothetical protein
MNLLVWPSLGFGFDSRRKRIRVEVESINDPLAQAQARLAGMQALEAKRFLGWRRKILGFPRLGGYVSGLHG